MRSADGVRNLAAIVWRELAQEQVPKPDFESVREHVSDFESAQKDSAEPDPGGLFVIVSAMGKTTNALEEVTDAFMGGSVDHALALTEKVELMHREITDGLFGAEHIAAVDGLFTSLRHILTTGRPTAADYDYWYDAIVSYGELVSTTIISQYLSFAGLPNRWLDMRRCYITDDRFREANIDFELSGARLRDEMGWQESLFIGQGFIGATADGRTVTLGREGSDYSAAVAAYLLDCRSVTIWKDVEGILNADPRVFPDAVHIPELTYLDAVELAYSGAQIIHPKTIKPLQNKNIPLYVRPFADPLKPGSVIKGEISTPIEVPILILKQNQVLISIRPNDFSFVLQEHVGEIISHFESRLVKINLIQSSAVNLSLCVDASRTLGEVIDALDESYRVVYNDGLQLLTIRGYTPSLLAGYEDRQGVMLVQKTRRIARVVLRAGELS